MTRALGAALLGVFSMGLAPDARADALPVWSDIPVGAIPAPPDHAAAPKGIAAGEHVEGVSVTRGPVSRFTRRVPTTVTGADRRCLAGNVDFSSEPDPSDRARAITELRYPAVGAVRSERLVVAADKATLEIVDAWIDPETLGARQHARTLIPLARLGRGPGGEGVYGFRHGDELEVVVPVARSASFRGLDGHVGFSDCASARVKVGTPESAGAVVVSTAIDLPPAGATARTGIMDVKVSVSRMSRDPAPVLGFAVSWTDDDAEPPPLRR